MVAKKKKSVECEQALPRPARRTRGLGLTFGLGLAASIAPAQSLAQNSALNKRYIVRVKSPRNGTFVSQLVESRSRTGRLAVELQSALGPDASVKRYDDFGAIVLDGVDLEFALRNHPEVAYIEEDKRWEVQSLPSSQDQAPWLSSVLGLKAANPDSQQFYNGTSPTIVAVVDTGMKSDHPFLVSAIAVNYAEIPGNGVDDDGNGYVDDYLGANSTNQSGNIAEVGTDHGSHVAGLVKVVRDQALTNYSQARSVEILPIRFIDESGFGTTSAAIAALAYAAKRGARVVNASWGAGGQDNFSQALYDAVNDLYKKDILFVAAAGNAGAGIYGSNNNDNPFFPSSFNLPNLLSVASITPEFNSSNQQTDVELSYFSNFGSDSVHIAAPGAYVDKNGVEGGVWSAYSKTNSYVRKKGTSMAAPLVAGVAGVVRAINPSLTAYEVKQAILESATKASAYRDVISSAALNAQAAFQVAERKQSSGEKPVVPSNMVLGSAVQPSSSLATKQEISSGCGALSTPSNEGPWGGNSLLLLATLFVLAQQLASRFLSNRVRFRRLA